MINDILLSDISISDNDSYTIQYLKLLIQNGLYTITNGGKENLLKEIYRLQGER